MFQHPVAYICKIYFEQIRGWKEWEREIMAHEADAGTAK